jgi:putative ABC transport system permease protein
VEVNLPPDRYAEKAVGAFYDELTQRASTIPGFVGITRASAGPPSMSFLIGAVQIEGQPDPPPNVTAFVPYNGVAANFFKVMGIRLVEGTAFTDTTAASTQAIVNEGFARKHWPDASPLGRRIRVVYNGQGEWKTIVGVARNALTQGLAHEVAEPLIYMPGTAMFRPSIIVRTSGDASAIQHIGAIVSAMDPRLPPQISSVELAMQKSIARPRFTMFLLLVFTFVAVGLAAVGLYGVLAYTVAQRTREIGIRMALGATRRVVAQSVFSQGLLLAGFGALAGLVAARWGTKLLSNMLYGVQQTDALSFAMSALLLVVIAAVACLVPVRRALKVDPVTAIRAD